MNARFAALTTLAALHLLLVVAGALYYQPFSNGSPVGTLVATYGALSGADSSYGFFAPSVASQLKAEFVLTDAEGHTWTDVPERGATREANLRFSSSIDMVFYEDLRAGVAASWGAAMLARHPSAQTVELRVTSQDLPTLAEYQAGARPRWEPLYQAKFGRASQPSVTNQQLVRNDH